MNINTYDITFGVRVARFKELTDYNRAELLRSFIEFMKAEGAKQDFLIANNEIVIKENK